MRRTHAKDKWTVKAYERHCNQTGKRIPVKSHVRSGNTRRSTSKKPTQRKKLFGLF